MTQLELSLKKSLKRLQRLTIQNLTRLREGSRSFWIVVILLSGALALFWDFSAPDRSADIRFAENYETAATHIPAGFVLVPIEVANYESLDSILGKHGVVDLYAPALETGGISRKVAERVKILRAPLNPSHFAVLAPEEDSPKLVAHGGPFIVAVQNPRLSGTNFVSSASDQSTITPADPPSMSSSRLPHQNARRKLKSRIVLETIDEK